MYKESVKRQTNFNEMLVLNYCLSSKLFSPFPSAVRSDSVRRPTPIPNIFITYSQYIHHNLQTLTKHIHAIYTHIFGV